MKTVLFLVGLFCFWTLSSYAQSSDSLWAPINQPNGLGQMKYMKMNNKSLMSQLMKTEFDIRQLKLKIMDLNKKRHQQYGTVFTNHNCGSSLQVKKIIDRLINSHCELLKNKELVYSSVKDRLDQAVPMEVRLSEEMINGDASIPASQKGTAKYVYKQNVNEKVAIAKQIPSNLSPLDLVIPTTLVMNGPAPLMQEDLYNENQTATTSMAADKFLNDGKLLPKTDIDTAWLCSDIEKSDNDSNIASAHFSLVCQNGKLRVKSRTHEQSFINTLISCKQKKHSGSDVWKEVQPDKSVIFYACIDDIAAPLYQMDWNPKKCSEVGKGYGEVWYAVSHYTDQPCTVSPISTSFSNVIKGECQNPNMVKRNIEVIWSCNNFGHIVPAQNPSSLQGQLEGTFVMGLATVGKDKLWSIFYRVADYADPNASCKIFDLEFRNYYISSGTPGLSCQSPRVEAYDMFPSNQAQLNNPLVGQQYIQGVKCEGTGAERLCYINCRSSCNQVDDFGKANYISMGVNPNWLAPGTPEANYYPDMDIPDAGFSNTFFDSLPLTTIKRTDVFLN